MLHYWSHYKQYLACPEQYRLHRVVGLPFEFVGIGDAVEEGENIHEALSKRLVNIGSYRPGNSKLMKQYHERYKIEDEAAGPWLVESTFPPVEIAPNLKIAAKIDAFSRDGLVRDTKRKGRRGYLAVDVTQLQWYCIVASVRHAQLDLIYSPGWERADWGLERLDYEFNEVQLEALKDDIMRFHRTAISMKADGVSNQSGQRESWVEQRNPNSCSYCSYTERCWPGLVVR